MRRRLGTLAMIGALGTGCSVPPARAPASAPSHTGITADSPAPRAESPQTEPPPVGPSAPSQPLRLESAHRIADETTWQALAARPGSSTVGRTEVVKFVIDTQDGRRLWFFDSRTWEIHFEFARDRLFVPSTDHERFNLREYRQDDRRFELGTITHYLDADLWTLELIGGDTLSGPRIARLLAQLQEAHFVGSRLRFRPLSPVHERAIDGLGIPTVSADDVFRGLRYQPLSTGIAYGTLRIVRTDEQARRARPDDVVVLATLPDELPVVAGIVSAQFQAPLGHLAVLSAGRGTPNMGLRGALEDSTIRALEGQLVRLAVGPQGYALEPARPEDVPARPTRSLAPPALDLRVRALRDVCALRLRDAGSAGAKAAQLGEVCGIGIETPRGFVIPLVHAREHVTRAQLDPERASPEAAVAIRERLLETPVPRALLRQVRARIARQAPSSRWILRSSTNAEDLPGFSFAGLYESVVVPAGASEDELDIALRRVWASLYRDAAIAERAHYGLREQDVAMAVLAQPFVDQALVSGVAITANPFSALRPGHYVNAQAAGGSVTGAAGEELPEQHLLFTYTEVFESEQLGRSARSTTPLLRELDLMRLSAALTQLHAHFVAPDPRAPWPHPPPPDALAVDVEFLVAGPERRVVILQARPFTVRYDAR